MVEYWLYEIGSEWSICAAQGEMLRSIVCAEMRGEVLELQKATCVLLPRLYAVSLACFCLSWTRYCTFPFCCSVMLLLYLCVHFSLQFLFYYSANTVPLNPYGQIPADLFITRPLLLTFFNRRVCFVTPVHVMHNKIYAPCEM